MDEESEINRKGATSDVAELEKLLGVAEEIQLRSERLSARLLPLRLVQWTSAAFATALVIFFWLSVNSSLEIRLLLSTVSLFAGVGYFVMLSWNIRSVVRRRDRERRALNEVVTLLHEVEGAFITRGDWTAIDRAQFKIRLSRIDFGERSSSELVIDRNWAIPDRSETNDANFVSGLEAVVRSFADERIDWEDLFETSSSVDISLIRALNWRNAHGEKLMRFVRRRGVRLRIVLPDIENNATVAALSQNDSVRPALVAEGVKEAEEFFRNLAKQTPVGGAAVEIIVVPQIFHFNIFRFDKKALLVLYSHRPQHIQYPTIISSRDGFFYQYVVEEMEALIGQGVRKFLKEN